MRQQARPSPKEEAYLDSELEKYGLKARITHMKQPGDCYFKVVTAATPLPEVYLHLDIAVLMAYSKACQTSANLSKVVIMEFARFGAGVALCHYKDNFDRRKGRIIAKRRLLNIIKEENKQ